MLFSTISFYCIMLSRIHADVKDRVLRRAWHGKDILYNFNTITTNILDGKLSLRLTGKRFFIGRCLLGHIHT